MKKAIAICLAVVFCITGVVSGLGGFAGEVEASSYPFDSYTVTITDVPYCLSEHEWVAHPAHAETLTFYNYTANVDYGEPVVSGMPDAFSHLDFGKARSPHPPGGSNWDVHDGVLTSSTDSPTLHYGILYSLHYADIHADTLVVASVMRDTDTDSWHSLCSGKAVDFYADGLGERTMDYYSGFALFSDDSRECHYGQWATWNYPMDYNNAHMVVCKDTFPSAND